MRKNKKYDLYILRECKGGCTYIESKNLQTLKIKGF